MDSDSLGDKHRFAVFYNICIEAVPASAGNC